MSGLPPHLLPLLRAESYPHPVTDIRLVETHISWVLLTGQFAYKLKRPVHYPFIDLRSAERRDFYCSEEARLNMRFAPQLYLGVCRIVADNGGLRIADQGVGLESAVRMRQFDGTEELDRLVESRLVEPAELESFGREIAAIHTQLPRVADSSPWGAIDSIRAQLRSNFAQCRELSAMHGTGPAVDALGELLEARLRALEPQIASRRQQGHVRECHGDLHSRNVVRYQGRLIAFDCLEFEPAFRWIDVAEEVAFLWMDLAMRDRTDLALAFLSGYLAESGDFGLCRMLRLYGPHRALVRAKVAALEARGAQGNETRSAALEEHRAYVDHARRLLVPTPAMIVLMAGLSGSGKTWLARQLAPVLGAVHLRSDVERKRLAGISENADSHSDPGRGLYSSESNRQIYEHLATCAQDVLAGSLPVIVDATFVLRDERAHFRRLALERGVDLIVVHCQAPRAVLEARITQRRTGASDASEADLAVLEWQCAHVEAIGDDEALRVVRADTTRANVVAEVGAAVQRGDDINV